MNTNDYGLGLSEISDECLCPHCRFMAQRPEPRNRTERRALEKEMARALKIRHSVQMMWVPFDSKPSEDAEEEDENIEYEI